MQRTRPIGLLLGAFLWSWSADAQEQRQPIVEITYERALVLAREQSPALATARGRIREAVSQVDAASVWRFNPQLSGAVGPRFRTGERTLDWSVGAEQWLELGGQRRHREEAARASATAEVARIADEQRLLLREVGIAFATALYWEQRVTFAIESLRIAESVARVAALRQQVGDVGALEEMVAELSVVRARSEVDRAKVAVTQTEARLKALLGVQATAELVCRGDLRRLGAASEQAVDLGERPDLRALRADIRAAEAQGELGRASRVPNLGIGAVYSREESAHVAQGTLTVELPVFDHGQGTTAVAEAHRARLRFGLDAASSAAAIEAHSAHAIAERLSAAARRFELGGLTMLEQAERLADASYRAGAIPLAELLAVRHELLQAKLDYAELLLGAATARVDLAASSGTLR